MRALVVDDVQTQIEMICKALHDGGIATTQAHSGKEALSALQQNLPDVVILDVIMPDMSGFEVLRVIRKGSTTRKLPVVMLTTKGADHDKAWGLDMGADAYLTKPFDPENLVSVVRRLA